MTRVYKHVFHLFLIFVVCLAPNVLRADVVVTTELDLNAFQIIPDSGTLNILSPTTAFVFGQALDSSGGFDQETNSVNDSATSTNASTTVASASGAASAPALTGSVTANINLPNDFNGFANSEGQALLSGSFEITGTANPVNVTFNALLNIDQSLETTGGGQSATSETTFTLLLPDLSGDPVLFSDVPNSIGPDSVTSTSTDPTLTTSMLLEPDTPYSFVASLDAEADGVNITPEPSSLGMALTLVGLLTVLSRTRFVRTGPADKP
jgi:hypothetical protein